MSHNRLQQLLAQREAIEIELAKYQRMLADLNVEINSLRGELRRKDLPCWTCTHPLAIDARGWLGAASEKDIEQQSSPSGVPLICCRVQLVGVMPGDAARAAR
jgi:hypothetical protein